MNASLSLWIQRFLLELLNDLPVEQISDFEAGLFEYIDSNARDSLDSIVSEGKISDETAEKLEKAIKDYKGGFKA